MNKSNRFPPEVCECTVRMIMHDHRDPSLQAANESIAAEVGCVPQTLHGWVRQHKIGAGLRDCFISEKRDCIKVFEREVKELR